jgi:hypothetical protein
MSGPLLKAAVGHSSPLVGFKSTHVIASEQAAPSTGLMTLPSVQFGDQCLYLFAGGTTQAYYTERNFSRLCGKGCLVAERIVSIDGGRR